MTTTEKHAIRFEDEVLKPILQSISTRPDRNAFFIEDRYYSYRQLGEAIATVLDEVSSCAGERIGLVINNDLQTYASILALWLAGKCYVPLHPHWPIERCMDIVAQVDLDTILDSSSTTRYAQKNVIGTAGLTSSLQQDLLPAKAADSALAYILFTSGSTGRPKGVQISRQNVAAFMDSFWRTGIRITEEDRCLQCFDLSFDVSVQSYLVALTRGACVYTVPYGQMKFLSVASLIDEQRITFGALAPSTLRYLQPYFDELDFSSFRQCILTAEASHADLVHDWLRHAPGTTVYDFYGPTEGTVYATFYRATGREDEKTYNGILSIGKPLANVVAQIVDENGKPVEPGQKGELCLAGPQITPGYWADEQKNRQAFFQMPVDGREMRFYHTGDLCWQDPDGDILYSGRIDNQAKIQGFRVELSEIEFHAHAFLQDKDVVCVAYQNEKALDEIALFIESEEFDTSGLVRYLRTKMPQYMIPSRFLFIGKFPINANGKTDRNKLKEQVNL